MTIKILFFIVLHLVKEIQASWNPHYARRPQKISKSGTFWLFIPLNATGREVRKGPDIVDKLQKQKMSQ